MTETNFFSLKNGTDVRGVALEGIKGQSINLTEEAVTSIAKAFYVWICKKTEKENCIIAVGNDSRLSADTIKNYIVKAITDCGGDIIDTGLSSTPSMFMLLKKPNYIENRVCDGSIMITASHLPFNKNGMKFFYEQGGLESDELSDVLSLATKNQFPIGNGKVSYYPSLLKNYSEDLVNMVRVATGKEEPLRGKKIIVDAGNGAGGFYAEDVLKPLGADTTGSQFLNPDGKFPNHIPNPENEDAMQSICQAVLKNKADFGIIFDTDVDRAGAVDQNGNEINRNRLIALISAILLQEKKGAYIVTDSVTSDGLTQFIKENGGIHHRFKRGYKNVINESKRLNAEGLYSPLAIETSGHAALQENYFLDDGAYLVTRLLISLAKQAENGKNLTSLISNLPEAKEATELRPTFDPECDFKEIGKNILNDLLLWAEEQSFIQLSPQNYEGVRMNFDKDNGNGWALVRMSLHEPILPINAESNQVGGNKIILTHLYNFLKRYSSLNLQVFLTCL